MSVRFYTFLKIIVFFFAICLVFISCKDSEPAYSIEINANPHKIAPLTAELLISSKEPCKVSVSVLGDLPISQAYNLEAKAQKIPVLGLYAGAINKVEVTLSFNSKQIRDTVEIRTAPLPNYFPTIEINTLDRANMEPGMHAADIHYANYGTFKTVPMIFDDQGQVRWYLDLSFTKKMIAPFQRLKDGSLLMVDRQVIYQYDMLGKLLKGSKIDNNYGMHHDVVVLPNGDLLICVGKRDAFIDLAGKRVQSDSDFIILFDRKQDKVVKEWDLAKHLDVSRKDQNPLGQGDWLHMNSLDFNPKDSTILVSGRHQGIIKLSWDDKLKWVMSPQKNWGKAGRDGKGPETKPFLLTAINSENNPYAKAVQDGSKSADDFDFVWAQHAAKLLPNGQLMAFDNGLLRHYKKDKLYSRAVIFDVNEQNKTVKQVWQYGKERGAPFYSSIVCDVDLLPQTEHILITSGFINPDDATQKAVIVEVDPKTGKELFEATLHLKTLTGTRQPGWGQVDVLYRSERMELNF